MKKFQCLCSYGFVLRAWKKAFPVACRTGHGVRCVNERLFCARQSLQGEDLASLMRADGNATVVRVPL